MLASPGTLSTSSSAVSLGATPAPAPVDAIVPPRASTLTDGSRSLFTWRGGGWLSGSARLQG